jgi:exopolyphosphatase/guanosine-5'-triphosphate,3'-diphosphate pyrophosphatase
MVPPGDRDRDRAEVERLLGRPARGAFTVVVRHDDGSPLVIRNAPLLDDGTPMPTLYWLVGEPERTWMGRLEASGGVDEAEAAVDPAELAAAHERYRAERDADLPARHTGPTPFGGVAGTRRGVKCLHAHYAWFLAGGDDPVGRWIDDRLRADGTLPAAIADAGGGAGVRPGRDVAAAGGADGPARPPPTGPLRCRPSVDAVNFPGMSAIAALDLGTNSTRVLIARPSDAPSGLETLLRRNTITRLGQGVDASGELAPEAIERTLAALRDYRRELDRHGVERMRMAATSAARDATNRDALFDGVEEIVGIRPELISGEEEGRLSFLGATRELDPALGPFLVVDIGGGSTEFIAGRSGDEVYEVDGVVSVDVGCVRLTEKFLLHDPPQPEELSASISLVDTYLEDVRRDVSGVSEARTLVGVAGTITTVAAIEIGLAAYDRDRIHHFHLTRDAAEDVFRTLATESRADRLHNPGLEEARADVIVGGCCVLVSILRRFGFDELIVSESDILDGLALSLV